MLAKALLLRLWYAADVAEAATRIPDVPCAVGKWTRPYANGGLRQNVNRKLRLVGFASLCRIERYGGASGRGVA